MMNLLLIYLLGTFVIYFCHLQFKHLPLYLEWAPVGVFAKKEAKPGDETKTENDDIKQEHDEQEGKQTNENPGNCQKVELWLLSFSDDKSRTHISVLLLLQHKCNLICIIRKEFTVHM